MASYDWNSGNRPGDRGSPYGQQQTFAYGQPYSSTNERQYLGVNHQPYAHHTFWSNANHVPLAIPPFRMSDQKTAEPLYYGLARHSFPTLSEEEARSRSKMYAPPPAYSPPTVFRPLYSDIVQTLPSFANTQPPTTSRPEAKRPFEESPSSQETATPPEKKKVFLSSDVVVPAAPFTGLEPIKIASRPAKTPSPTTSDKDFQNTQISVATLPEVPRPVFTSQDALNVQSFEPKDSALLASMDITTNMAVDTGFDSTSTKKVAEDDTNSSSGVMNVEPAFESEPTKEESLKTNQVTDPAILSQMLICNIFRSSNDCDTKKPKKTDEEVPVTLPNSSTTLQDKADTPLLTEAPWKDQLFVDSSRILPPNQPMTETRVPDVVSQDCTGTESNSGAPKNDASSSAEKSIVANDVPDVLNDPFVPKSLFDAPDATFLPLNPVNNVAAPVSDFEIAKEVEPTFCTNNAVIRAHVDDRQDIIPKKSSTLPKNAIIFALHFETDPFEPTATTTSRIISTRQKTSTRARTSCHSKCQISRNRMAQLVDQFCSDSKLIEKCYALVYSSIYAYTALSTGSDTTPTYRKNKRRPLIANPDDIASCLLGRIDRQQMTNFCLSRGALVIPFYIMIDSVVFYEYKEADVVMREYMIPSEMRLE